MSLTLDKVKAALDLLGIDDHDGILTVVITRTDITVTRFPVPKQADSPGDYTTETEVHQVIAPQTAAAPTS